MDKKILKNLDIALAYFLEKNDYKVAKTYLDQILLASKFDFEKKNEYLIQYYLSTNQFEECIEYLEKLFLLENDVCYEWDSILHATWKSYYEVKEYQKAYIAMYLNFHSTKDLNIKKEIKKNLEAPCFKPYYHPMVVLDAPQGFLEEKFLMIDEKGDNQNIKCHYDALNYEKALEDPQNVIVDLFDDILKRILFADQPRYIICGLSYMEGFLKKIYEQETLNFSLASQDIYYNYLILKYILEVLRRPELIETCIINLAYFSFDYDLSRKIEKIRISSYIPVLKDGHHFKNLKDLYTRNEVVHEKGTMLERAHYRKRWIDKKDESEEAFNNTIKMHTKMNYPEIRKENYQWFAKTLLLLDEYNIKAVVLITPVTKKYAERFDKSVISRFYSAIEELQNRHSFKIADYFQSDHFVEADFSDSAHLNTEGFDKLKKVLEVEVL